MLRWEGAGEELVESSDRDRQGLCDKVHEDLGEVAAGVVVVCKGLLEARGGKPLIGAAEAVIDSDFNLLVEVAVHRGVGGRGFPDRG